MACVWRARASRSWTFLRNCFTYSMVSPSIDALSIFVTNGTKDLKIIKRSFSFSLRRRSAKTWFPLGSSCSFWNWEAVADESTAISRNFGDSASVDWCNLLLWRNGTVKSMLLSSHCRLPPPLSWREGFGLQMVGHDVKADWAESWEIQPITVVLVFERCSRTADTVWE